MLYMGANGEVDAVTFDEFVKHGREQIGCDADKLPRRFTYGWHPVTLNIPDTVMKGDKPVADTYLIVMENGLMQFHRGEILVASSCGALTTYTEESFYDLFEPNQDQ